MSEKKKYQLEYIIKTSPKVLFTMISTPSGLSEWFADDVNIRGDVYTFLWDGSEEKAELMNQKNNEYIRFRWEESDDDKTFFEFRITIDPLTKEVALIVTDFCEDDEKEESTLLWDNQIQELMHVLGS